MKKIISIFLLTNLFFFIAELHAEDKTADKKYSASYECKLLAKKLSSVHLQDCLNARLKTSGYYSVKGLPLLYKEYPPLKGRKPQARILLIGGIHGDEYSSISIVFKWMKTLDRYHSGLFHWHVAPAVNPDGLLQKKSKRMNANGVDLNRNFKTKNWQKETEKYWLKRVYKDPRRYPGKSALSEPETQWISAEIEKFKPDAIISVHAPYGLLDFDGEKKPPKKFGYLYLKLLGTYPGSLGNYASNELGIPVLTLELPYAGIMPSKQQISKIWVDLIRWLKKNIQSKKEKVKLNG